jgi:magnesium chelatase family protein
VGGGSAPRPGEISLAHHGVLFLDELPEFDRDVLEVLREPLESGRITISRAARQCDFPARFQLVAAMNPCPCGYLGDPGGRCHCTPGEVARYRNRISGPFLDRIDLHVGMIPLTPEELASAPPGEASAAVRLRVCAARERQLARQACANALLQGDALDRHCALAPDAATLAKQAATRLRLSARAYHRLLRVARSIADLAGAQAIGAGHLAEAIQYRQRESPA